MVAKSSMYDSQSPSNVEAKITRVSLSKITNRKSCTVAIRSVFFWRSPVKPSASSLRMRSAPPGFSAQMSVNSFDCPAFVPGRVLTVFFVSFGVAIFISFRVYGSAQCQPLTNSDSLAASSVRTREPLQRSQSRHEAVCASAHGNELRQTMNTPSDGTFGDGKKSISNISAEYTILLCSMTYEIAVRYPLRLHELELTLKMCTDQQKDTAAIYAVVLQDT